MIGEVPSGGVYMFALLRLPVAAPSNVSSRSRSPFSNERSVKLIGGAARWS